MFDSTDGPEYAASAYDAAEGADAVLILTDWQKFGSLDLERLGQLMRFRIIVDGHNLYSPADMTDRGFTYLSIGRPDVYPVPAATVPRNSRMQPAAVARGRSPQTYPERTGTPLQQA